MNTKNKWSAANMKIEWNASGQGELWTKKELAAVEKTWLTSRLSQRVVPTQMAFNFSPQARTAPSDESPTGQ
jgi:hypothetical protein